MTGTATDVQWYIARDGKQHGPLTETEMRLFVQGGHLKPADLIWRPGFADWRPAPAVFPTVGEKATSEASARSQLSSLQTAQAARSTASQSPGAGQATTGTSTTGRPASQQTTAGRSASSTLQTGPATQPGTDTHQADDPSTQVHAPNRSARYAAGAIAACLVLGVAGWFGYENYGDQLGLKSAMDATDLNVVTAPETNKVEVAATDRSAPAASAPKAESAEDKAARADAELQNSEMWRLLKKDFPDWYKERVSDIIRMREEDKNQSEIATHLVTELVNLRRKHAEQALAANTDRLVEIARTFLANLKKLAAVDDAVCYSFISQGETSPSVIALNPERGYSETIEEQIVAIFRAISEGKRSPNTRLRAQKPDYDRLAEQLGRLGWSQADLQLFADPGALGKAPPERVCKMVQDWFAAHIAVDDKPTKDRLLYETLRPVIAG